MLLSPGLVRPVASFHSLPDVQGLKSAWVAWCLQSCALQHLAHTQLQPVGQPHGCAGLWDDAGAAVLRMASLCSAPQLPYPQSSSHPRRQVCGQQEGHREAAGLPGTGPCSVQVWSHQGESGQLMLGRERFLLLLLSMPVSAWPQPGCSPPLCRVCVALEGTQEGRGRCRLGREGTALSRSLLPDLIPPPHHLVPAGEHDVLRADLVSCA